MKQDERTFPPLSAPDREMLNAFLQYQRDTLEWKCTGLSEDQLKQAASAPSPLTLLGLLRHMTVVEYHWFENVLMDRRDHSGMYTSEKSPEADWTDLDSAPAEEVFRRWKQACQDSSENAASLASLDYSAARTWDNEPVTLRWITTHMIEEYARHVGHADFLRERLDGETGE